MGAGISYASYDSPSYDNPRAYNLSYSEYTYSGVAPTFFAGADFQFPRFSRNLYAQVEVSYTPWRSITVVPAAKSPNRWLFLEKIIDSKPMLPSNGPSTMSKSQRSNNWLSEGRLPSCAMVRACAVPKCRRGRER